ncbi:MAG: hypothetical protein WBD99_02120 [Thermodesulfobacteriota bacterium]
MQSKRAILNNVFSEVRADPKCSIFFEKIFSSDQGIGVHLAVFSEPFLSLILEGKKTVESRFAKNRCSPHGKIFSGDVVLLKKTGGPVVGMFIAGEIEYFPQLDKEILEKIKFNYHVNICADADSEFWAKRKDSQTATLVKIEQVCKLRPFNVHKSDRTGWVVLRARGNNLELGLETNISKLTFT